MIEDILTYGGSILVLYISYQLFFTDNSLKLYYHPEINKLSISVDSEIKQYRFLDYLKQKSDIFSNLKKYNPTIWLRNCHLQTYFTVINRKLDFNLPYQREILSLEDGGQVALDWYPKQPTEEEINDDTPVLIILHGLSGSSKEFYCRSTIDYIINKQKINIKTVVFNYRGCGDLPLLTPRLYNAGDTRDLKQVLEWIGMRCPKSKLFGVGFSLGANLLVKYIGEEGEQCKFSGAISISNPNDLLDCSREMARRPVLRTFYDPALSGGLARLFDKHKEFLKDYVERKEWRTVRDFDRDITRVFSGHKTVNDYYRWATSSQFLGNVKIPLLILNARDDPISPHLSIPIHEAENNPYVLVATTELGGHVGWWEGNFEPNFWFPKVIEDYLKTLLEIYDNKVPNDFIHN